MEAHEPETLDRELETIRQRIETVARAVTDEDVQERLAQLRQHLSTVATLLGNPTATNLRRAADRVRYTKKQFDVLLTLPGESARGPYSR